MIDLQGDIRMIAVEFNQVKWFDSRHDHYVHGKFIEPDNTQPYSLEPAALKINKDAVEQVLGNIAELTFGGTEVRVPKLIFARLYPDSLVHTVVEDLGNDMLRADWVKAGELVGPGPISFDLPVYPDEVRTFFLNFRNMPRPDPLG